MFHPFVANLGRYKGSSDTLNDWSDNLCVPNKTKDVSSKVFNMIRTFNELKSLVKHISCDGKCKFDKKIYSSKQK